MTQKALAVAVGVSPAAVAAWVKIRAAGEKRTNPTQKNLEAMVAALGLTMAEFYGAMPKTSRRPGLAA